jgi:hypothetical protein
VARDAGIDRDVIDALEGHSDGTASFDYGEFALRETLGPAIGKMRSAFPSGASDVSARSRP